MRALHDLRFALITGTCKLVDHRANLACCLVVRRYIRTCFNSTNDDKKTAGLPSGGEANKCECAFTYRSSSRLEEGPKR